MSIVNNGLTIVVNVYYPGMNRSGTNTFTGAHHDYTNPIWYVDLLPARQDVAIILPARQHMNHHLPAGTIYQLLDLYQLAGFKHQSTFFDILDKWVK